MTEPTVLYSTQGAVALVTLNRPQALNSFTRRMHRISLAGDVPR